MASWVYQLRDERLLWLTLVLNLVLTLVLLLLIEDLVDNLRERGVRRDEPCQKYLFRNFCL